MKLKIFVLGMCTLLTLASFAQLEEDINDLMPLTEQEETKDKYSYFTETSTNELQMVVALFFKFYKHNISSQDGNRCTFYPSCSTYAAGTIRQNGLFEGCASTADRLSRCHHGNEADYDVHIKSGLKYDPVNK